MTNAPQKRVRHIDIDFTLKRVFQKPNFRPLQREIITAALDGEDVFLQAATSFGKSLCFQLPAIIDYGITIVVSPLLALMNNQVAALRRAKIVVATINGTTPHDVKMAVLEDLQCGHPRTRLLYVTPEYCAMDHFRRILRIVYQQRQLSRIAVDEAHCISEWGHDFRKSFEGLSFFRREFPDVPIMCCTATATARVREDIINTLELDALRLKLFTMTTVRNNLHYEVRFKSDDADHYDDFLKWLRAIYTRRSSRPVRATQLETRRERIENVSGIIYTWFRKDCDSLAARLCDDGIGAKPYHAGLSTEAKDDHLAGWVANKQGYDVIVATTAFGMGIDKEDVRFVVHWQLPKSFEGFYQEAGRAGRDGKCSACILYYSREDRDRLATTMARENARKSNKTASGGLSPQAIHRAKSLQALVQYCESTSTCRHKLICQYFGENTVPECDYACDWHKDGNSLAMTKDRRLASEEWCSTQREAGAYDDEYD
ncbi:ATP-dependent DNA helicase recQ [Aulographum hederae CBS 113979]|uniref:ATP-dependent DNA helicase n=1 Tax=Aulographum hederae CBS 113979 TaxID=1176131 RepID=A0A6G1GJL5_9PEZI|nr:ATP-dependent DNA helicase recQ [Aulographum hederae CBS 113979]